MLSLAELPWLRGHALDGDALYPAAAYIVMMLEVARFLARGKATSLVELSDLTFDRTLPVPDGGRAVEIITAARVEATSQKDMIRAVISFSMCQDPVSGVVNADICTGSLTVFLGVFRGLTSLSRGTGVATATARWKAEDVDCGGHGLVHPGLVDTCIHPVLAALAAPAMGRLKTSYLPQRLKRLIFNPEAVFPQKDADVAEVQVDAYVTDSTPSLLVGDFSIYVPGKASPLVQVDGLSMSALGKANPADDRLLFSKTVWQPDLLSSDANMLAVDANPVQDHTLLLDAERAVLFICRMIVEVASTVDTSILSTSGQQLLSYAQETVAKANRGEDWSPAVAMVEDGGASWLGDGETVIDAIFQGHAAHVEFALLRAVYDDVSPILRGEKALTNILKPELLVSYLTLGAGPENSRRQVARYMASISHRYPHANVVEICGTGAVGKITEAVFDATGAECFGSYTLANASADVLAAARECLAQHPVTFRKLEVTNDLKWQGLESGAYDVVVLASDVLQAGADDGNFVSLLANVRSFLRPGGFLVTAQPTGTLAHTRLLLHGGGPSCDDWDDNLRRAGFSGLEVMHHDRADDDRLHLHTAFVSQALTQDVVQLRQPLSYAQHLPPKTHLAIVGGATLVTSQLVREAEAMLGVLMAREEGRAAAAAGAAAAASTRRISIVRDVSALGNAADLVPHGSTVLYLGELDRPAMRGGDKAMDPAILKGLQALFTTAASVMVVTRGAGRSNPSSNMMVGLCRALRAELRPLRLLVLDLDEDEDQRRLEPGVLLQHFLRFAMVPAAAAAGVFLSDETELRLRDGTLYLPRVREDEALNARLNTRRRQVSTQASLDSHELELLWPEVVATPRVKVEEGLLAVHVRYSTVLPVQRAEGLVRRPVYLCLGTVQDKSVLLLSETNRSIIRVQAPGSLCPISPDLTSEYFAVVAVILAAQAWVRGVPEGSTVWLHGDFASDLIAIFENVAK
ncbi:hypothetical protein MCOR25_009892 [Pyricularia grisea]|nr:hypothetical protein MCOR25_009892 [Pyricularia grisea]